MSDERLLTDTEWDSCLKRDYPDEPPRRVILVAQDTKTLKAMGKWLRGRMEDAHRGDRLNVVEHCIETLMRGEMPSKEEKC